VSDEGTRTVPLAQDGVPVRAIRVEVVSGPDAGEWHGADTDVLGVGTAAANDLVLTDRTVSRFHLELRRQGDRILVVDQGSTNGTAVGGAVLLASRALVRPGTVVEIGQSRLRVDDGRVVMETRGPKALGGLRGGSEPMRRLMATIEKVAATDVPVMILGESGTGKELAARAIHDLGAAADAPFVTIDCGSLSPTLFASELFGHEKGAFTGADRRRAGAFERAVGGTVFLDEVGELLPELQASLLGVLERRRVRRLGGNDEIPVDARLVCATHRDLRAEVNAGTFRLDLYYRIAVVRLLTPPLRDRPDDVPLLVEHFLREAGHEGTVETLFPGDAIARLQRHPWPGNVRELRNVVLGTLALGRTPELDAVPETHLGDDPIERALHLPYREARAALTDRFERRYLTALLDRTAGNIRAAAREARMDRSYLMELLKRHGMR